MKRYAVRAITTFLAFVIGVGLSYGVNYLNKNSLVNEPVQLESGKSLKPAKTGASGNSDNYVKTVYPTSKNGTIEVRLVRFEKESSLSAIKLEIINHGVKPAIYSSQDENFLFFQVKFNGKEKRLLWCGTGAADFELGPGESITQRIQVAHLYRNLDEKGPVQIGYYFLVSGKERSFWSEKVEIPGDVEQKILENLSKQLKIAESVQTNKPNTDIDIPLKFRFKIKD